MSTDRIKGSILYALHIHDRYIANMKVLESKHVIFFRKMFFLLSYMQYGKAKKLGVDLFDKKPQGFNINCTLR